MARQMAETAIQIGSFAGNPLIWRTIGSREIFGLRYVHSSRQTALIYQTKNAFEDHRWLKK
jgi:hypothetical protein